MHKVTLLPKWVFPGTIPSVYDTESGSALEMTAKVYNAMKELQEEYNSFVDEINEEITNFINTTNKNEKEFICSINKLVHDYIAKIDEKIKNQDNVIKDAVDYMKINLDESIHTLVTEMIQNGELNETILNALDGISDEINSLKTKVTNLENKDSEINTKLTDLESKDNEFTTKINTLDETTSGLVGRVENLEGRNLVIDYDEESESLNISVEDGE